AFTWASCVNSDFPSQMREYRRINHERGLPMKRSAVVIALAMAPIALSVCIGVAFGTPGSNAVSVYPARGSVGSATEPLLLGTPQRVTITRTCRVKNTQG